MKNSKHMKRKRISLCTIGAANLDSFYIFKNLDPVRGSTQEQWIEQAYYKDKHFLVIRNSTGCYGGLNELGVGLVGSFVNMKAGQNNYFDDDNLLEILGHGDVNSISTYLSENSENYYGNIICCDGNSAIAFELNGKETRKLAIDNRYLITNHFRFIDKHIRTWSDPFIKEWTESRLIRGEHLLQKISSFEGIHRLLSDHDGKPDFSICNHGKIKTVSSYIIDCTNKIIHYCPGNPCEHNYITFSFN